MDQTNRIDPEPGATAWPAPPIPSDAGWHVDRDAHVAVLRYDGGDRQTMGIEGADQISNSSRNEPNGMSHP